MSFASLPLVILLIVVYLAVNVYVYLHGLWAMPQVPMVRIAYSFVVWACALAMFAYMALRNMLPLHANLTLSIMGGYWLMMLVYFILCCLIVDVVRFVDNLTNFYPEFIRANYVLVKLMVLLIVIGGAAIIMVRGYQNFTHVHITTLTLETPKKQSTIDSLRIVAVSDIHLGSVVRKEQLRNIVDNINALKPDIVLIAGDLVDNSLKIVRQQHMEKELRRIKAKYGCYAALGNHDYFDGADKTCKLMLKAGIVPLRDMGLNIDNAFVVAGREDYSQEDRLPLSTILSRNVNVPVIVLDHQPRDMEEAAACNVSLQIMGHTHAGQVFPFNLVVQNMYGDFTYGYQQMGGTHFYTSSGAAGWGAPMRSFSRSEIVLINLKFSNRIK